ncbi:hypothetical protein GCM10022233_50870 [Streptomyces shaanxiensis]|uniref:Uncharacterized protein n=1 Tax=Streptomyces shaanxiensis TaxID=653357 RepID=A0ABP7VJM4_9ACTN
MGQDSPRCELAATGTPQGRGKLRDHHDEPAAATQPHPFLYGDWATPNPRSRSAQPP